MADGRAGSAEGYAIATVANLTGLDPHTIRAWERRYGAVQPRRTEGGTRRYGDDDVARLQLMKALTECGEPIRVAASLSDDELRARLAKLAGVATPRAASDGETRVRLAVLHPTLATQMREDGAAIGGLEIGLAGEKLEPFVEALRVRPCDALVLSLDALGPDPLAGFEACRAATRASLPVVLYTFARRRTLAQLADRGARLVRGPLPVAHLRRVILDLLVIEGARRRHPASELASGPPADAGSEPPARRFNDAQLARLAEIASAVDCECPNHLSALVVSLLAFERYARDCESRDAADAALHARLARGTGRARGELETLLAELCEHDGINI